MNNEMNFLTAVRIARLSLAKIRKAEAEYEADVRDWYDNGDGRSPEWVTEYDEDGDAHVWNIGGRGYTYPECIHGSSRWTDYDNICGGCEDSYRATYIAACDGWAAVSAFNRRMDWFSAQPERLPEDVVGPLVNWCCEPLNEWAP